jgi:hypothetical protein
MSMTTKPETDEEYEAWLNAPDETQPKGPKVSMAELLEDDDQEEEDARLSEAFAAANAAAHAAFVKVFAEYGYTIEPAVRN